MFIRLSPSEFHPRTLPVRPSGSLGPIQTLIGAFVYVGEESYGYPRSLAENSTLDNLGMSPDLNSIFKQDKSSFTQPVSVVERLSAVLRFYGLNTPSDFPQFHNDLIPYKYAQRGYSQSALGLGLISHCNICGQ